MKKNKKTAASVSRRQFLPLLSGVFIPLIGSSKSVAKAIEEPDVEYQTLLTKDGKVVKVKANVVTDSTIVDNKLSNQSMLKWLKK